MVALLETTRNSVGFPQILMRPVSRVGEDGPNKNMELYRPPSLTAGE